MTNSRSLARRRALNSLGPHATVAHAHAIACRVWQPYKHYGEPDAGHWLRSDIDLPLRGLPVEEALTSLFTRRIFDRDEPHTPPTPDLPLGCPLDLPQNPFHPGTMDDHPALLDRADAITLCMPALVLALLDGEVPTSLAVGAHRDARRALAGLQERYAASDLDYDEAARALIERGLRTDPAPDTPLELWPTWRWMVYVTQESSTPGGGRLGAADGMPLRCFDTLEFARRYAIVQTDWSREIAGLPRDDAFHAAIARLATEAPDGSDVTWEASTYITVIEPRQFPSLTVSVPASRPEV